jgi:hypothetical protein
VAVPKIVPQEVSLFHSYSPGIAEGNMMIFYHFHGESGINLLSLAVV